MPGLGLGLRPMARRRNVLGSGVLPTPAPSLPSYSAMPAPATYAGTPYSGYRVLNDDISMLQWGMADGLQVTGDGAGALDDNTGSGSTRDQVLKLSTAGGAGNAYVAEQVRYIAHDSEVAVLANSFTKIAGGFWQIEFLPVAGECVLFAAREDGVEEFRIGIVDAGDGGFYFVLNNAVIGSRRSYGAMTSARWSWDAAGNFVVQSKTSGSWRTEFSGTDTAPSDINEILWGCMGPTKATDIRVSATSIDNVSFARIDRDFYLSGSGTRDINQGAASMALFIPDGLFAGQNKARIRWAAGADPTSGTAESYVALSGKVADILGFTLTGLSAGTAYSYQFEIADVGGTVLHTSSPYKFRTMAATGASAPFQMSFTSCYGQLPSNHPYHDDQFTLEAASSDFLGTMHLGDAGYEASDTVQVMDYWKFNPPETVPEFEQKFREFFADIAVYDQLQLGMYAVSPDDHETINQGDVRMAPGGVNENVLANDYFGDQSDQAYGATTTLGDLWAGGIGTHNAWFNDHLLDKPSAGVRYQKKAHGKVEIIQLDTRYERDPGSNLYVSATQLAWAKAQIDAIAASTEIVLLVSQAAFCNYTSKDAEAWETYGAAQFEDFYDYCVANIPSDVQFAFVTGDDHILYALHQNVSTTANPSPPANWLGEVRASGGSIVIARVTITGSDWYFPQAGIPAGSLIRSSGIMFDINADATTLDLSVYADGSERNYNAFTVAVPDTTAPVLTLPTDAANGSTGGSLGVTTDEGNGNLYWYVSTSATPPSATDLADGTGSVDFGSQAVSGTGIQTALATGLTAETGYYAHFMQIDAASNQSAIVSGDGFTTEAAATFDPVSLTTHLYDGANAGSITLEDTNTRIAAIADLNGTGPTLVATGSARPYAGRTINGAAVIDLRGAEALRAVSGTPIAPPYMYFAAFKFDANGVAQAIVDGSSATERALFLSVAGEIRAFTTTGVAITTATTDVHVALVQVPVSGNSTVYLNGSASPLSVAIGNASFRPGVIGARYDGAATFADGALGVRGVIAGTPTLADINNIGQFYATRYGTAWATA